MLNKILYKVKYGYVYLSLIPLFGIIYYFLPIGSIDFGVLGRSLISSFYYSAVTVTTLGYGDITPINELAALLTAIESVLGVMVIGLFLNQIAHKTYSADRDKERKSKLKRNYLHECDKLLQFANVINHLQDEDDLLDSVSDFILVINMHDWPKLQLICTDYIKSRNKSIFEKNFQLEVRNIRQEYYVHLQSFNDTYW